MRTMLICILVSLFYSQIVLGYKCNQKDSYWKSFLRTESWEIGGRQYDGTEFRKLKKTIDHCSKEVAFLKQLSKKGCFENFNNFLNSLEKDGKNGHSYGFLVSDDKYFSNPRRADLLKLPEIFSDGLPSNWKDIPSLKFEHKGESYQWEYAEFRSRLVPNITNLSYDRITFFRQTKEFDQWIQFTTQGFDFLKKVLPGAFAYMDMIVVEKQNSSGQKLKTPIIHFKEYVRNLKGKNPVLKKAGLTCYSCHPNGPRPISPDPLSVTHKDKLTIDKWNKIMSEYGGISYGGAIIAEQNGPAIGNNLGKYSCTKCHNDFQKTKQVKKDHWHFNPRGAMNYRMTPSHIKARMVEMLEMPTFLLEENYLENLRGAMSLLKNGELRDNLVAKYKKSGTDYHIQERMDNSLEMTIQALRNEGHISHSKAQLAIKELKSEKKLMKRAYEKLMSQYRRDLENWMFHLEKVECQELLY